MATDDNPEIGRSIDAAGIRTNCLDAGDGPPVMLLHGSGPGVTAWANWRLVLPQLSPAFRVIAPDIVGFGYTERPADAAYDMARWTEHAIGVLDALDIEKCGIVGNSFGGALALALAVAHPGRVDRMVLMGSAGIAFDLTQGLDAVWGYEPSIEAMRGLIELFAFNQAIVTEDLVRLRYEASIRPGYQDSYAAMFPAPRQRHIQAMARSQDELRAIGHQSLIVHGREDRIIPLEASIRLAGLIPRAQLHVFGQCGHWTQIEQNARFCRLIADFFSEPAD